MKFRAKRDFLEGYECFEAGNLYTSEKHSLSDSRVEEFYQFGWVDIEGREPGPDAKPGVQKLEVHSAVHNNQRI